MATSSNSAATRSIVGFEPSAWGDRFLDNTHDSKVSDQALQEMAKELKEEIKRELLSLGDKPLIEQLCLIDSIQRLGVAYQFDEEIADALQHIHEMLTDASSDNLVLTSLCFRLLRKHGFIVSCDVFRAFKGSNGSFKEEVANDVEGMLSLYEACHVRVHGEEILDEALAFTISNLESFVDQPTLGECIRHTLHKPLHKRLTRVECVHHMQVYEQDPLHHKTLLKFAKLDFNMLQALHKQELCELCRWWKGMGVISRLPLRDRIVESYFWSSAVYFEPKYSIERKITAMGSQILTSMDDIYDAYGTIEELEVFTEAVQRWDKSCLDKLPEDLRWCYKTLLLDGYKEMERYLAPKGRSQYVHYLREETKGLCASYLIEARWRHENYTPTPEEYMQNVHRNAAYVAATVFAFIGMDEATDKEFQWVCKLPTPVKAICFLLRILNDIAGNNNKLDRDRGHHALLVECYVRQHQVTYERAWTELLAKTQELWKDINQAAFIQPTEVPAPLLKCIVNLGRALETIYDEGEDGFTSINTSMKYNIESLYQHSVPIQM